MINWVLTTLILSVSDHHVAYRRLEMDIASRLYVPIFADLSTSFPKLRKKSLLMAFIFV